MTTAADIQARLEELWENAEPGPFERDDAIIFKHADGTYAFRPRAGYSDKGDCVRVVERAKPKAPEWEAVVASCIWDEEHHRQAFIRDGQDTWMSADWSIGADDLVDPVPLVEMPSREEIKKVLADAWNAWKEDTDAEGGADPHRIDALLKLLRGER